jgi:hypothetical protein
MEKRMAMKEPLIIEVPHGGRVDTDCRRITTPEEFIEAFGYKPAPELFAERPAFHIYEQESDEEEKGQPMKKTTVIRETIVLPVSVKLQVDVTEREAIPVRAVVDAQVVDGSDIELDRRLELSAYQSVIRSDGFAVLADGETREQAEQAARDRGVTLPEERGCDPADRRWVAETLAAIGVGLLDVCLQDATLFVTQLVFADSQRSWVVSVPVPVDVVADRARRPLFDLAKTAFAGVGCDLRLEEEEDQPVRHWTLEPGSAEWIVDALAEQSIGLLSISQRPDAGNWELTVTAKGPDLKVQALALISPGVMKERDTAAMLRSVGNALREKGLPEKAETDKPRAWKCSEEVALWLNNSLGNKGVELLFAGLTSDGSQYELSVSKTRKGKRVHAAVLVGGFSVNQRHSSVVWDHVDAALEAVERRL